MAYSDIVNVDYSGRSNTSTGAAGTTTGSGGELVDRLGGRVSIASGKLNITNNSLEWLTKNIFPDGSITYELNQIAEFDLPAGMTLGKGHEVRVRAGIISGTDRGGYGLRVFFGSSFVSGGNPSGIAISLYAINAVGRDEHFDTYGLGGWITNFTYNSAKPYRFQLKVEQAGGLDTITTTIYDMTTGSPVSVVSRSGTKGTGGSLTVWSDSLYAANFGYLDSPGRIEVGNSENPAYNGGVALPTEITRLRFAHENATPALSCSPLTLTSRATGTNTIDANSAGGNGNAVTFDLHASTVNTFTPGAGNIIVAGDSDGTYTHSHGHSATSLSRGTQEITCYRGIAKQSGSSNAASARALMVQALAPAFPTASVRSDILGSRKVIVGLGGDSLTGATSDATGATLNATSTKIKTELTDVFGIPSGNIIMRQIGAPGSSLSSHWRPGSGVLSPPLGYGTDNNLKVLVDALETTETANSGALVVASFSLLTNDLQTYSGQTPAQIVGYYQEIIDYIRTTRGKTNWLIVINDIPFGTAITIDTDAKLDAYLGWRRAIIAATWGGDTKVYIGSFQEFYGVYSNTALLDDGVHYTSAGNLWRASRIAEGLAYGPLYDIPSGGSDEDNMTLTIATTTTNLTSAAFTKIGDNGDTLQVSSVDSGVFLRTVATGGAAPSATLVGIPLGPGSSSGHLYTLSGVDLYARADGSPATVVVQK